MGQRGFPVVRYSDLAGVHGLSASSEGEGLPMGW